MDAVATAELDEARRFSFADLSVNAKISAAVGLAALVALVVGVTGLLALGKASNSAQLIYTSNVASIEAAGQIKAAVTQARVDLANQALSPDAASLAKFTNGFTADLKAFDAAIVKYRGGAPAGDPATIDDLQTNWTAYVKIAQEVMLPAGARHDLATWAAARGAKILPVMTKIYADVSSLDTAEQAHAATNAADAKAGYRSSRIQSIIILVVGLAVALGLGLLVSRRIVQSLTKVTDVCLGLADGDLTRTSGLNSRDEPGRMGHALDTAVTRLRQTIATIEGSAASLAGASEQMTGSAPRSPRRPKRPPPKRRPSPPLPSRCPAASRPSPPAASRWAPRSGRSRRTPARPPESPPRPSPSPPPPRPPWASSASPPPRSAT